MGTLRGQLDSATWTSLSGWAYDAETPGSPVELEVLDDDQPVARVVANRYRQDMVKVGRDGCCSFLLHLPLGWSGLSERSVTVRRVSDGAILPGSPIRLEPPADPALRVQRAIEQLVRPVTTAGLTQELAEYEKLIKLLANTTDRVLRARLAQGQHNTLGVLGFYERWQPILADQTIPVQRQAPDCPPSFRKRALFIGSTLPNPERSLAQAALIDHMGSVRRLGYEVAFAPQDMGRDTAGASALESRGIAAYLSPFYGSVEEVLRRHAGMFDMVYIHQVENFMQYGTMVRTHLPRARLVYSAGTPSHLHLGRRAAVDELGEFMRQSRVAKATEIIAARLADSVVTHSPYDATMLAKDLPQADIRAIAWTVPVGSTLIPFADRHDIAFLAGDAEDANLDAVLWLMESIMPKLIARSPNIRCKVLAGPAAQRLPRGDIEGISFLDVKADPGTVLERVRLTVAPLRYGSGLNGRVLQSLAAGVPCVCSAVAAEGLSLPSPLDAYVGNSPQRLADLILHLHEDAIENAACAQAGSHFVAEHFNADRIDRQFASLLGIPSKNILALENQ